MENISDMYYLFRFIVGRIFVYLRDIILHELSWFPDEMNNFDPSEARPRSHPFSRRAIADFVAFFTICAFFGAFFILSTKCAKEGENNYNSPPRPDSQESEPLEVIEDEDYSISDTLREESRQKSVWGDTAECEVESTCPSQKLQARRNIPRKNRIERGSIIELRASLSQHSQSTQTNERILQRVTSKRDWLIRRTRSGHIYGKYPL